MLDSLLGRIRYVGGTFDDPSVYERVETCAVEYDEEAGISFNRVFYLSTAPSFFPVIVRQLGEHGLDRREDAEVHVVIEKPFGTNLEEARQLNHDVLEVLDESAGLPDRPLPRQGDRPEHDGVPVRQRHVRADLEPQLHRLRPDHGRRGHRDRARAPATTTPRARCATSLQNHMLQLLTLLCMEPPVTFSADDVRDEKVKVLHAIEAPDAAARRRDHRARRSTGRRWPG